MIAAAVAMLALGGLTGWQLGGLARYRWVLWRLRRSTDALERMTLVLQNANDPGGNPGRSSERGEGAPRGHAAG